GHASAQSVGSGGAPSPTRHAYSSSACPPTSPITATRPTGRPGGAPAGGVAPGTVTADSVPNALDPATRPGAAAARRPRRARAFTLHAGDPARAGWRVAQRWLRARIPAGGPQGRAFLAVWRLRCAAAGCDGEEAGWRDVYWSR